MRLTIHGNDQATTLIDLPCRFCPSAKRSMTVLAGYIGPKACKMPWQNKASLAKAEDTGRTHALSGDCAVQTCQVTKAGSHLICYLLKGVHM